MSSIAPFLSFMGALVAGAPATGAQTPRPPVLHVAKADLYDDVVVSGPRPVSPVIAVTVRSRPVDLDIVTGGLVGGGRTVPDDDADTAERVSAPTPTGIGAPRR